MKTCYFDNAATTELHPIVKEKMIEMISSGVDYGNPSSLYDLGQRAKHLVEEARETVAHCINARPDQVVFTSGGTESNNTICRRADIIISPRIEHPSMFKTYGRGIRYVDVNKNGTINEESYQEVFEDSAIKYNHLSLDRGSSIVATVAMVNNEIGVIQSIRKLAKMAHDNGVSFHTDAVQAAGHVPINVRSLGVDSLSISAHKFHGPKGVGVLYTKYPVKTDEYSLFRYNPFRQVGGEQENGQRAGTENVLGIVATAEALRLACEEMEEVNKRLSGFKKQILAMIDQIKYSLITSDPKHTNANFISCCFMGVNGQELVTLLNEYGICVSAGSACHAGNPEPSHVLRAIGVSNLYINGSLRITMSRFTTQKEVDYLCKVLPEAVSILRNR